MLPPASTDPSTPPPYNPLLVEAHQRCWKHRALPPLGLVASKEGGGTLRRVGNAFECSRRAGRQGTGPEFSYAGHSGPGYQAMLNLGHETGDA
jgi:hypothetical protein